MRNVALDPARFLALSTGNVSKTAVWIVLADGSRRPDPTGRQETHEDGRLLWNVEVVIPGDPNDDRDKTETFEVTVASADCPNVGNFGTPLHFDGLVMALPYKRKDGQLGKPKFAADGARPAGGAAPRPAPNKDAA